MVVGVGGVVGGGGGGSVPTIAASSLRRNDSYNKNKNEIMYTSLYINK